MLVERVERELVDVDGAVYEFEETACSADILHYEMAYAHDYFVIVRWQHLLHRSITQKVRNKI